MRLRKTEQADAALIAKWIESDPHHQSVDPQFFFKPRHGANHLVLEDERGYVQFYVTLENVVRAHIQFNPEASKRENGKALAWFGSWVLNNLPQYYAEFITDSKHSPLIGFLKRLWGLHKLEDTYSVSLAPKE